MECVFCKIINRELPAEILFENNRVISFLDIHPIHYGHALVLPKTHSVDFLSVPDSDLCDLMRVTHIVTGAIVKSLKLDGFNIFSNNGTIAGQSVFHFHFHITPRYPDDNIRFILKLKEYENGEIATYAEDIRQNIALSTSFTRR